MTDSRRPTRTTRPPAADDRFAVPLCGVAVDPETRCAHYDDPVDVVAIRFPCCGTFYPCYQCHDAVTDHDPEWWSREAFDSEAVRCGACGETLTIDAYIGGDPYVSEDAEDDDDVVEGDDDAGDGDDTEDDTDACPACGAPFNPGCRDHYHLYFDT